MPEVSGGTRTITHSRYTPDRFHYGQNPPSSTLFSLAPLPLHLRARQSFAKYIVSVATCTAISYTLSVSPRTLLANSRRLDGSISLSLTLFFPKAVAPPSHVNTDDPRAHTTKKAPSTRSRCCHGVMAVIPAVLQRVSTAVARCYARMLGGATVGGSAIGLCVLEGSYPEVPPHWLFCLWSGVRGVVAVSRVRWHWSALIA